MSMMLELRDFQGFSCCLVVARQQQLMCQSLAEVTDKSRIEISTEKNIHSRSRLEKFFGAHEGRGVDQPLQAAEHWKIEPLQSTCKDQRGQGLFASPRLGPSLWRKLVTASSGGASHNPCIPELPADRARSLSTWIQNNRWTHSARSSFYKISQTEMKDTTVLPCPSHKWQRCCLSWQIRSKAVFKGVL